MTVWHLREDVTEPCFSLTLVCSVPLLCIRRSCWPPAADTYAMHFYKLPCFIAFDLRGNCFQPESATWTTLQQGLHLGQPVPAFLSVVVFTQMPASSQHATSFCNDNCARLTNANVCNVDLKCRASKLGALDTSESAALCKLTNCSFQADISEACI